MLLSFSRFSCPVLMRPWKRQRLPDGDDQGSSQRVLAEMQEAEPSDALYSLLQPSPSPSPSPPPPSVPASPGCPSSRIKSETDDSSKKRKLEEETSLSLPLKNKNKSKSKGKSKATTISLSPTLPPTQSQFGSSSSHEPLSEYTCPICFFPPSNATLTPCGHVCCGSCLFTAVKTTLHRGASMGVAMNTGENVPRCPVCRAVIRCWDGRGGGVIGLKVRMRQ